MSVATPAFLERPAGSGGLATRPTVRGARLVLRGQLAIWGWFWLTLAVVATGIVTVTVRVAEVQHSIWNYLGAAPRWFGFTMVLLLVSAFLGPLVAQGLTRRAVVAVVAVDAVVTAVVLTACWTLGHAVETVVFRAQGWPTLVVDHLYTDGAQLGLVVLETLPTLLTYGASGALVGAVYYRAGGWWGTLALPLTLAPVVLTEALLTGGWVADAAADAGVVLPTGLRAAAVLLLAGLALALVHLALSRAAVRRVAS